MDPQGRRFYVAFAISFAVHVVFVVVAVVPASRALDGGDEARFFEVTPLAREMEPNEPTEEEIEEDEDYDPEDDLPEGQVVDAPEAGEERRPEDSRFLANRDQVVDRETRARFQVPGELSQAQQPTLPFSRGMAQQETPRRDQPMLAGLMVRDRGLQSTDDGQQPAQQSPPPMDSSPLNLRPSVAVMSDAVGGTGLDALGDVEDGERSLLNTVRWRHAPFFQRVKDQVRQYWHPDVAFMRHDPGGHVYGYRDRETVLRVVLDTRGSLERVYVLRGSGADFLDDEARRAIEQAAPFPHPPARLVDERTGRVVFTFGFIVELGERPIFRLRRYRQ